MSKCLLAALCAVLLVSCSRSRSGEQQAPQPPSSSAPQASSPAPRVDQVPATSSAQAEGVVSYIPSRDRVLFAGETGEGHTSWLTLGAGFAELRAQGGGRGIIVAPSTLFSGEAALTEAGTLPALSRVTLLGSTAWERVGGRFRKLYHVRVSAGGPPLEGWVDCGTCAVITAEKAGLSVGVLERKVVVSDGDSEYSVLVLARGTTATLIDTSSYLFPESFHPGGIVSAAIDDPDGDGVQEAVVVADFIVSLSYLGASPLRSELWLRERGGTVVPVLRINRSFGTDEGYEYTADRTVLDTDGDGFRETVKVVTQHRENSGQRTFQNTLVSFYVWDGSQYRKDAGQDLPRLGTITADGAALQAAPGSSAAEAQAGSAAAPGGAAGGGATAGSGASPSGGAPAAASGAPALPRGTAVFVYDRSDSSEPAAPGRVFWFHVLTRDAGEGWVRGSDMSTEWADPYKVNRGVFLGTAAEAADQAAP
jgi:hypothetical protein